MCDGVIKIGLQQLKFLTVIYATIKLITTPVMISAGCNDVVNAYHIKKIIKKVYTIRVNEKLFMDIS